MQAISLNDKYYPSILRDSHDAPQTLYVVGQLSNSPMIAVVGSRKPTAYGEDITYRITKDLALAGLTIVSGLAYGIDAIAHRATLDAGGTTIAVLGSSLDNLYPASHRSLAQDIVKCGGAVISEYPAHTPPRKHHFPARNRIIAGLSQAILVPEADARSGSLITAQLGLDENRLVMAVPGPITSPRSAGPNNLLKAGAIPVTSAADVLIALNLPIPVAKPSPEATPFQQALVVALKQGSLTTEDLSAMFDVPVPVLLSELNLLELNGRIRALAGSQWALA